MKHTNIFLIMFCFIILSIEAYAIDTTILDHTFNYVDAYENHGWTNGNARADNPTLSIFTNNAFGLNTTVGGSGFTKTIGRQLSVNRTSGLLSVQFAFYLGSNDEAGFVAEIIISNKVINLFPPPPVVRVVLGNNTISLSCGDTLGCSNCGVNLSSFNLTKPVKYDNILLEMDLDNKLYTLSVDGVSEGCVNKPLANTTITVGAITLTTVVQAFEVIDFHIDNLIIITSLSENITFDVGIPCDTGADCTSGKCQYGVCRPKLFKENCDNDGQCLSNGCVGGKCTKPSFSELLDAAKTEQFGDDSKTNNLISIFIMTGITLIIVVVGAMGGNMLAGIIGGILLFLVSGIGFALLGWLSAFILFGIFIVLLVGLVFAFMMGGGSS